MRNGVDRKSGGMKRVEEMEKGLCIKQEEWKVSIKQEGWNVGIKQKGWNVGIKQEEWNVGMGYVAKGLKHPDI